MPTGSLKKYFADKGFGFIAPDDGTPDIFAPKRSFQGVSDTEIREGAKVHFEAELEERTNKMKASKWTVLDGLVGGAGAVAGLGGLTALSGLQAAGLGLGALGAIPGLSLGQLGAYGAIPGLTLGANAASPYGLAGLGAAGFSAGLPLLTAGLPAAAATTLPPGWEQVTDPTTQRPYYCNRATGESSWTPPVAAAAPILPLATAPLAPAEATLATTVAIDPNAVATVAATMPTTMPDASAVAAVAPVATPAVDATALVALTAPAVSPAPAPAPALPDGWEQGTDPASGKVYFFNRATGQTSWTPPAGP